MLVNRLLAFNWLVHCKGVQLSQLHQQNCWLLLGWCTARGCSCLSCTNKTVGYCLVGALQGGAAVSAAPTKLLATAWLVHLRQVHPLRLLHEHLLHLATCCAHDVDAALQVLHAYTAEGVDGYILVVVGCSERVDCCRVGVFLAEHYFYV